MENAARIRFIIFLTVVASLGALMMLHPFFALTDVAVSGLDSYASQKTREIIDAQPRNYFIFSTWFTQRRMRKTIALERVMVEKKFPHTITVTAVELKPVATLTTKQTWATIDALGRVLRIFEPDSGDVPPELPRVDVHTTQKLQLYERPMDDASHATIMQLVNDASIIERRVLRHIIVDESATIYIRYDGGVEVIMTAHADVTPQIAKARAAMRAYVQAHTIDVRYGDKAFVKF